MHTLTKAQKKLLRGLFKIATDGENALACSIEIVPWEMLNAKGLERKGIIQLVNTDATLTEYGFIEGLKMQRDYNDDPR